MELEGNNFVDAGEAAAWYEEKVREVVNDDEIVGEIFRFSEQIRRWTFSKPSPQTTRCSSPWCTPHRRAPWAALIVQRGRLWGAGEL